MSNYNIVSSSSSGNAIIYHNKIMVDCGVAFKHVEPYIDDIEIILLTHKHRDHLRVDILQKILEVKDIKIICPEWLYEEVKDLSNVIKIKMNKMYQYKGIKFSGFYLYHNVENCGYRIIENDFKIFHATDTAHLNGIKAIGYDLYAIEHNYDAQTIQSVIDEKLSQHKYCYEMYAVENHMSFQIARKWLKENMRENSKVLMLHVSSRYYENGIINLPKELIDNAIHST